MKIALMHPYRHHSYNIVEAISHTNNEITAFYGYYNKDNLIYRSLERVPNNKIISKFLGYNDANIDKYVQTNIISKLLFLQSKVNNSKSNKFTEKFDNYCYSKVNKFDTLIFLQDHCQKALDNAFDKNKKVIYDHILPCGYKQRKILLSECEQLGIGPGYADKYMPEEKIEKNYINISKENIILNASYSTYSIAEEVLGIEEAKKRSFLLIYHHNGSSHL